MLPTDSGRTGPDTGGGRLMRAVGLALRGLLGAIGLIFIIALVVPLIAEMSEPSAEEATLARVEADMPRLRNYGHIALPTTPPPAGGIVHADDYLNELSQSMRFMYQDMTVYACVRHTSEPRHLCNPPRRAILARHRSGPWQTYIHASAKFGPAAPHPAIDHFRNATLTPRPGWVQWYSRVNLTEMYTPAQG